MIKIYHIDLKVYSTKSQQDGSIIFYNRNQVIDSFQVKNIETTFVEKSFSDSSFDI